MRVLHAVMLATALVLAVAQPGARGALAAQEGGGAKESSYVWTRVTSRAVVPAGANYPVFVQGKAYAFHPDRTWSTADGRGWKPEPLPDSKLNTAYLQYVQHDGAIYALGEMKGSYSDFSIDPVVRRTTDFKKWETLGRGNLPERIFYTVISFRGSIWLITLTASVGPMVSPPPTGMNSTSTLPISSRGSAVPSPSGWPTRRGGGRSGGPRSRG